MSGRNVYRTKAWQVLRKQALIRDRYTCQLRLSARCTGTRNLTVDHTDELWQGGASLPPLSGLKTACRSCNARKHMDTLLRKPNPSRDW